MHKDSQKIRGFVRLQLKDKEGKILQDNGFEENIITNAGLAGMAGLVGNTGAITAFTYLAVGTGNTAAAASQTTLVAEITDTGLARASAVVTRSTTTQTNDTLQLDFTWTASGTKVIAEIGVFNAASVGIMLARKVPTSTLTTANGNTITATYKIIFS